MDQWCHTPVLPTSLPEDRWPSTSPRGWDRCLWTGTGTSPATWRTALSLRTLYRHRDRSSTFLTRSILLTRGPARTRNPRLWWRRRGRQSCDLQDILCVGMKMGKKQIMKQSQDGLEGTAARINTASFFSCESSRNIADWWGSRQKGCITFVSWAAFIWGMMTLFVVANTLNPFANHLPHSECVKGWKQTAVSYFFSTAITVVILFSVCFFGKCLLLRFCAEIKPGLVTVVASNSLNNLCKARWFLSALSGKFSD